MSTIETYEYEKETRRIFDIGGGGGFFNFVGLRSGTTMEFDKQIKIFEEVEIGDFIRKI